MKSFMAAALGNHMMKKTILVRWSMGIMLAACVSVTPARAQKLESADFRRGIGIAHVMAWASIDPGASRAFTFPPFQYPADALERELGALHRTGFDFSGDRRRFLLRPPIVSPWKMRIAQPRDVVGHAAVSRYLLASLAPSGAAYGSRSLRNQTHSARLPQHESPDLARSQRSPSSLPSAAGSAGTRRRAFAAGYSRAVGGGAEGRSNAPRRNTAC
jgi:hypothetical protein